MGQQPEMVSVGDDSVDAERFRTLYARHLRAVTAYCLRRIPRDRVDDAVAETFLVAWRRIADVPEGDAVMLWLYGVARNVVTREWRSAGRRRRLGARLAFRRQPAVPIPEDVLVDDDETRRVLDAAGRLNDSDAEVLRLLAWEHLTPAEIATVLEITPNAVHQRLHRAKRNLVREYDRPDVVPVRSPAAPEGGA